MIVEARGVGVLASTLDGDRMMVIGTLVRQVFPTELRDGLVDMEIYDFCLLLHRKPDPSPCLFFYTSIRLLKAYAYSDGDMDLSHFLGDSS